jgi:hypothetical protein
MLRRACFVPERLLTRARCRAVHGPSLVRSSADRPNGEQFAAQLGPPIGGILPDRQFAGGATFVRWADLDVATFGVDGRDRE